MNNLNVEKFIAFCKDSATANMEIKECDGCFFIATFGDYEIAVGWSEDDEDVVAITSHYDGEWLGDVDYVVLHEDMTHDECVEKIVYQMKDTFEDDVVYVFKSFFNKAA